MTKTGLRLLHLSDIHFLGSTDTAIARNADLRNEIESDLGELTAELGPVDAILISGDLAYSGFTDQYKEVEVWLHQICELTRCRKSAIFTVPGNHDVEQPRLFESHKNTHDQLRECDPEAITARLERVWAPDDPHREMLFEPISAYNDFANPYGCRVDADNPSWQQSLPLSEDLKLRITGLTSTLVSGKGDSKDGRPLIVGVCQVAKMVRNEAIVDLVICHHPPDWLLDAKQVEPFISRAAVQLFGHKHVFETSFDGKSVRVAAGAVHPDAGKPGWEPRYNLIELRDQEERTLGVDIYPRVWHDQKTRFVGADGSVAARSETFEVVLDEDELERGAADAQGTITEPVDGGEELTLAEGQDQTREELAVEDGEDQELREIPIDIRDLVYRFLNLPFSVRVGIAVELGLLDPAEIGELSEHAVFEQVFVRAKESDKLSEVHDLVRERGEAV